MRSEDEWDLWRLSELQMMAAANEMLCSFGMVEVFEVPLTAFRRFFNLVARLYKSSNPYHNLYHGFDVMKTCYFFLELCQLGHDTPNLSGYALLVAGLCHDVGHPGRTNLFQMQTSTELAIRYNDHSVLENYHAALTFRCMQKAGDGMYGSLDSAGRKEMRKIIVECILATDISNHVKVLKAVNDGSAQNDHLVQLKLVLCASDVSNPWKPKLVFKKWTELINEEFFQQGDEERRRRIDVSPFCDRLNQNVLQHSVNFMDFVVGPVLAALKQMYPARATRIGLVIDELQLRRKESAAALEEDKMAKALRMQEAARKSAEAGAIKNASAAASPSASTSADASPSLCAGAGSPTRTRGGSKASRAGSSGSSSSSKTAAAAAKTPPNSLPPLATPPLSPLKENKPLSPLRSPSSVVFPDAVRISSSSPKSPSKQELLTRRRVARAYGQEIPP
jgi:hypothetical protein